MCISLLTSNLTLINDLNRELIDSVTDNDFSDVVILRSEWQKAQT